ncbi:uncharacterized protein FOMMEDRAFT_18807 [Fomitiporia mediterranea MF3/22]|uniref:uncharacterized protein n=1 Tax=Fomitiporia mediterranea (strain MF3/22) TaxID=694068 RepID=UPI00044092CA|nr:uncharacterized protein FOMMEDRAFT_18807 [Fomitiporia mediterranea MF3/22]EJD05197.1 hypothetical protein FOMMEDRAFT_18807 [Fomitiporia mediterranea MF3/22]
MPPAPPAPPAPPPYAAADRPPAPPFSENGQQLPALNRPPATFEALPPHLVLYITQLTLKPRKGRAEVEYTRKVLYWMTVCLRMVNRSFYIACMHVLRSTYLPAYLSMIKPPYTSDPFPLSTPEAGPSSVATSSSSTMMSPVNSVQRETQVLDLFLTAKVREDVWADESELHLEREEAFLDLFSVLQPRARLEDLVRTYGSAAGVISVSSSTGNTIIASGPCPTSSPISPTFPSVSVPSAARPTQQSHPHTPTSSSAPNTTPTPYPYPFPRARGQMLVTRRVPFSSLTCSFGPRSVGLVLTTKSGRRTIVEVPRAREEKLEVAAKRLVKGLEGWVQENYTTSSGG